MIDDRTHLIERCNRHFGGSHVTQFDKKIFDHLIERYLLRCEQYMDNQYVHFSNKKDKIDFLTMFVAEAIADTLRQRALEEWARSELMPNPPSIPE